MPKLSIIIPFVNEWPQVAFTIQTVLNEIRGMEAEVIVIDNFCQEITEQKIGEELCQACFNSIEHYREKDRGGDVLAEIAKTIPNLIYIKYDKKLSHWNAKNAGVKVSSGDILLFLDAHIIPSPRSIHEMFKYFIYSHELMSGAGTLHLPLSYMLANDALAYKFKGDPDRGFYHYEFCGYKRDDSPVLLEVPAMSTCGMMMTRTLYDELGGWPVELGIYGGGENFINYTLSILGRKKWVFNIGSLYHYADRRGYFYNYDDFIRNRCLSTFIFAGEKKAYQFIKNCQGNLGIFHKIFQSIVESESIQKHKAMIDSKKIFEIDEWLKVIKSSGLWNGHICKKEYVS